MSLVVKGAWSGWNGETIVELSDGTIWRQDEYVYEYRYSYRPSVAVARGAATEQNLALGRIVVVDAVNDSEPARDTWRRASGSAGVPLMFVLLVLDDEVEHRRRLEGRRRNLANVLEPTWDDVRTRRASFEPWGDVHLRMDARASMQQVANVIVSRLSAPPAI
jgi:hypothetical protein